VTNEEVKTRERICSLVLCFFSFFLLVTCHSSVATVLMKFLQSLICVCVIACGVMAQQAANDDRQQSEEVRDHYETAQAFERAGDWAAAEREWQVVVKLARLDARAWVNLGVALNRQNKSREAIAAWTEAASLDPKLMGAHFNLGLAHVRNSEFAEAINPLRRALALDAGNDAVRRTLAVALIGVEQYPEASRELARLLTRAPRDAALLELAAQSFMRQRRFAEALIVLKRRLDLGNETSQIWALYGDALDGTSRTPEAIEAYKRAVELAPEATLTRYGLGYLYWKQYRYDEAERELTEVLRRDEKDARAAFTLGDLYLTKGDAKRALPLLERAAQVYPNEYDTRFALGRALVQTGDAMRGIEELRAAVRLDDSIADGHFQLGRTLTQIGQRDEGRRELERARELHNAKRASEATRVPQRLP
jgi:tetratricopeptide (TPR) repeat protein